MEINKYKITYSNGVTQEKFLIPSEHEYFKTGSPLANAIETGILKLPKDQGGEQKVKIEKVV